MDLRNERFHHLGDIVFTQYRAEPIAIVKHEVIGIHIRKGARDTAFELLNHETGCTLMEWGFRVFSTVEEAFAYRENVE